MLLIFISIIRQICDLDATICDFGVFSNINAANV